MNYEQRISWKLQSYQASIQCMASREPPAKYHLKGVWLAGRWCPTFSSYLDLWILSTRKLNKRALGHRVAYLRLIVYKSIGKHNWAATCDFEQCGTLTSVDSGEPLQPPCKIRNIKSCSICSFTLIEYSNDKQRLWSDCAYAQADLRLCWSHIPHCWKSHVAAHISSQSQALHFDRSAVLLRLNMCYVDTINRM